MLNRILLVSALLALGACEKPDSVELGQPCKGSAECKDPADTCMMVAGKQRCTMACDAEHRCPDGYACPVTDPKDKTKGSCLPAVEIADNVVTVY